MDKFVFLRKIVVFKRTEVSIVLSTKSYSTDQLPACVILITDKHNYRRMSSLLASVLINETDN